MRFVVWTLVSVGLHAALFALLILGLLPNMGDWGAPEPDPISFELLAATIEPEPVPPEPVLPEPVLPEPEPEPSQVAATVAPRPLTPPEPRRDDAPVDDVNDAEPVAPQSTADPPEVQNPEPPQRLDPDEARRRRLLLDPSNVARGAITFGDPDGPSRRGPPAGLGPTDRGRPSERELEQGLQADLRTRALQKRHTERAPFRLRRRSDGSHVWDGPRLTGIINPDGSVDFEDRPNVQTNGFSASGTFDATEAIMGAAGQDPLRAERDYFMRQTEELRQRLETQHRAREMRAALTRLRGRLERVWNTTSRSTAARRLRIFRIWDEITDDGSGRQARDVVMRFIRERLPEGSEDAYTEAELRRFNASRESREPFDPY